MSRKSRTGAKSGNRPGASPEKAAQARPETPVPAAGAKPGLARMALTLLLTCVLAAGLITSVSHLTRSRITAAEREKTAAALRKAVDDPEGSQFSKTQITPAQTEAAAGYGAVLDALYTVQAGGESAGFVAEVTAAGNQGDLTLMVGVDADGAVSGVSIAVSSEPALSGLTESDVLPNGTGVLDQFLGRTAANLPLEIGNGVEALTGFEASCRGVVRGVNGALAAVAAG